jgi:hypothetical protein
MPFTPGIDRRRDLCHLVDTLDEVVPSLARRREPLLLDVRVRPDDNPGGRPS